MNLEMVRTLLGMVVYPGMDFLARLDGDRMVLQVQATTPCNVTGDPKEWRGRKWFLSPHMTKSEVVQTALKAVLTALEHEAREQFKYRGRTIFDPHYDVDALWNLRGLGALDERALVGGDSK